MAGWGTSIAVVSLGVAGSMHAPGSFPAGAGGTVAHPSFHWAGRSPVFVADTPANLDAVRDVSPGVDVRVTCEATSAVVAAVPTGVGDAGEVHFVTGRDGAGADPGPAFRIHRLAGDPPDVPGDEDAWAEMSRTAPAAKPLPASRAA